MENKRRWDSFGIHNGVQRCLRRSCRSCGAGAEKIPLTMAFCSILVAGVMIAGLGLLKQELAMDQAWIPHRSMASKHARLVEAYFGPDPRGEVVIVDLGGSETVVDGRFLGSVVGIEEVVLGVEGFVGYCELLYVGGPCERLLAPAAAELGMNSSLIRSLSQSELERVFENTTIVSDQGVPMDRDQLFGGVEGDVIGTAKALQVTYLLNGLLPEEEEDRSAGSLGNAIFSVEDLFAKRVFAWGQTLQNEFPKAKVYVFTGSTFQAASDAAIAEDIPLMGAAIALELIFAAFMLGGRPPIQSRLLPALMMVASVGLAIGSAFGLSGYFGVPFTAMSPLCFFIVLAIGLDDSFVIAAALDDTDSEDLVAALAAVGPAITLTSVTDLVAFMAGATVDLPAVSAFCQTAGMAVLLVLVFQVTLFAPVLVLDRDRKLSNRADLCPCLQRPQSRTKPQHHKRSLAHQFAHLQGRVQGKESVSSLLHQPQDTTPEPLEQDQSQTTSPPPENSSTWTCRRCTSTGPVLCDPCTALGSRFLDEIVWITTHTDGFCSSTGRRQTCQTILYTLQGCASPTKYIPDPEEELASQQTIIQEAEDFTAVLVSENQPQPTSSPPPNTTSSAHHPCIRRFVIHTYVPCITHKIVRIAIILVFLSLWIAGAWALSSVPRGLHPGDFVPQDSDAAAFLRATEKYFGTESASLGIVSIGSLQNGRSGLSLDSFGQRGKCYTDFGAQDTRSSVHQALENAGKVKGVRQETGRNWLDDLESLENFLGTGAQTGQAFLNFLPLFVSIYPQHDRDLIMGVPGDLSQGLRHPSHARSDDVLLATRTTFSLQPPPNIDDQVHQMREITNTVATQTNHPSSCKACNGPVPDIFAFSTSFLHLERYDMIELVILQNLVSAIFACLLLLIIFQPTLPAFLVCLCIVGTDLFVALGMYVWDIQLNISSAVELLCATGFSLDYSAHVSEAIVHAKAQTTTKDKIAQALSIVGLSVFNGGFSTLLAVIALAGAQSAGFIVLFRMFLLLVGGGLAHGLIFLPALMSLLP